MIDILEKHLDKIIEEYNTDSRRRPHLMRAKEMYIEHTGMVDEDADDFESRMNNFYEWFIFNFEFEEGKTIISRYINENSIEKEVLSALKDTTFSVFEFLKFNLKKQIVIKDLLHDTKFVLPNDHTKISVFPGDIFVCRFSNFDGNRYMLRGSTSISTGAKSNILKQAKKVRRYSDPKDELKFLLEVQFLQNKSQRYAHIDPAKVFVFTE